MKRLIIILSVLIAAATYAQDKPPVTSLPVDPETKTIKYREVVNQEGTKDVLYDRGAEWMRSYYLNPGSVTKVQDKVNGKIEGTAKIRLYNFDSDNTRIDAGVVYYDIALEFKENRFRYTLTNFTLKGDSRVPLEKWMNKNDPSYNPKMETYLYQVDTTMTHLITKLKEGMKPKVIKKDEW
jgi:hypothetical protein